MSTTKINLRATLNGSNQLSESITRIETTSDGPFSSYKLYLEGDGNVTQESGIGLTPGKEISIDIRDQETAKDNNWHTIMKAYVEDIHESVDKDNTVFYRTVVVDGRSCSRDLGRLFVFTNFINVAVDKNGNETPLTLGDIFDKTLRYTESELSCYFDTANISTVVKDVDKRDAYLVDLYNEVCQKTGYNYTVNWVTKHLVAWPYSATPHYTINGNHVVLRGFAGDPDGFNNILQITPNSQISSTVHNHIKVKAGKLDDHWTEGTAAYLSKNDNTVTLHNEYNIVAVGNMSIKADCNNTAYYYMGGDTSANSICAPAVEFVFNSPNNILFTHIPNKVLDYSNIPQESCSVLLTHNNDISAAFDESDFIIAITDDQGHVMFWRDDKFKKGEWKKLDFTLGYAAPIPDAISGTYWSIKRRWVARYQPNTIFGTPEKEFTWRITKISILFIADPRVNNQSGVPVLKYFTGAFWVDGLTIPNADAAGIYAIAEDTPSRNAHGKSMIPLLRSDLKSVEALQAVAAQELAIRKDPYQKIKLTTVFQPYMLYAGLIVDVQVPSLGIGTITTPVAYEVTKIEHEIEPGKPLCRGWDKITRIEAVRVGTGQNVSASRLMQSTNPMGAGYDSNERRIQHLEDNQAGGSSSSSGGGGAFSGGSNNSGVEDGVVNGRFIVRDEYLDLYYYDADKNALPSDPKRMTVTEWLYGGEMGIPLPPGADWQQPIGIMFNDIREDVPGGLWHNVIHGIVIKGSTNPTEGSPAIGVTKHFFVRGDFVVRGPLSSHEGYINLWGNGRNAVAGNYRTGYRIGWGPTVGRKGTAAIMLPEGGHGSPKFNGYYQGTSIENYTFPYSDAEDSINYKEASTLVLAVPKNTTSVNGSNVNDHSRELGLSRWYGYGHFEAGNVTAHGHFIGAHLWTGKDVHDSNDNIMIHSNLVPYRLPNQAAGTDGEINLGNDDYRYTNLYARNIRDKNNATGGIGYILTRQQDGLEWKEPSAVSISTSKMQCGSGQTPQTTIPGQQTAGFVNIRFDVAFPAGTIPKVVATVKGAADPITIAVRNITNTGFDVNTLLVTTAQHDHKMGRAETRSSDTSSFTANGIRNIRIGDGSSNTRYMDGILLSNNGSSSGSAHDVYTENYTPSAGDGFIGVGTAFDWIAMAP